MRTLGLLAVLLPVSGCGLSFQRLPLDTGPAGETYGVTMVFEDVTSLPVGGQVRLGQAVVGRVESMSARDTGAYVRVRLAATTTDVLNRTQSQLVDRVATIRPFLDELAGLDADLGELLTAMDAFAPLFCRAVPGDYLQLDAELTVSGTLASLLAATVREVTGEVRAATPALSIRARGWRRPCCRCCRVANSRWRCC